VKYWVYKESRILGPFDKEAVSGLPGLDSGTLVCAGDPAGGSWTPAGELEGFSGIPSGMSGLLDDLPTAVGLLDQLQIDSAGLIGDDEFPGSLAEEMFQDASFKKSFGELTQERGADDAEARRAREKISELTAQLEVMYGHISRLESAQAELNRRLAAKDLELRSRPIAPSVQAAAAPPAPAAPVAMPAEPAPAEAGPVDGPAKTFLSPARPPLEGKPPPVPAVPEASLAPSEWPEAVSDAALPAVFAALPAEVPAPPAPPAMPVITALPAMPALAPALSAPLPPVEPRSFGKPKVFAVRWAIKSFRVIGPDDAPPPVQVNPPVEFSLEPIIAPAAIVPPPPEPVVLAAPVPVPVAAMPVFPSETGSFPANPFALPPTDQPNPFTLPTPEPVPMPSFAPPPNTLSRPVQPVPDFGAGDMIGSPDDAAMGPSATATPPVIDEGAAARFAKPEAPPPTGTFKKPPRSNKGFLIGGGVLVLLLMVTGVIFMRQPKEDMKQMTTLDDGKAPLGLATDDGSSAPPIVKPKIAEAPPIPTGPSAEHAAAIANVKDFPLDGGRGNVGRWLQYSYTADPNAGTEEWNASSTAENTMLVEYRLVPGPSGGGRGALYLFEVDGNGIVMGKNIEARQMLAGGPPPEAPKAKKPAKKAPKRVKRRVQEEPKEVPLLPLPDSGELRPPAEDDGSFGSDTIKSGI